MSLSGSKFISPTVMFSGMCFGWVSRADSVGRKARQSTKTWRSNADPRQNAFALVLTALEVERCPD